MIASDLHGRLEATRQLIKRIEEEKPARIWFLGDILYNGPRNGVPMDYDPMGVRDLLLPFLDISDFVSGNCDARIDAMLLNKEMPLNRKERAFDRDFALFHGDEPSYKDLSLKKSDILVYGHTHLYEMGFSKEGYFLLNPGSIGFPKEGRPATYMLLDSRGASLRLLLDGSAIKAVPLP